MLQWPAALAVPISVLVFATGWQLLLAIFIALFGFLGLLVGPIISVASKKIRSAARVPGSYSLLVIALWIVSVGYTLSQEHSTDMTTTPSIWENLGLPGGFNTLVGLLSILGCIALWICSLVVLIRSLIVTPPAGATS